MAKKKRHFLVLGVPVMAFGTDRFEFEVCPGRWDPPTNEGESDCAVIVQERKRGPLKSDGVFKMAIDPIAVEAVIEGLQKWLEIAEAGRLSELFPPSSHPATAGPEKACGSGPCRPSPQMFERSELGDGRQGETQDGPADGLPEV